MFLVTIRDVSSADFDYKHEQEFLVLFQKYH